MIIRTLRLFFLLIGLISSLSAEGNDEQNKLDIIDRVRKEIVVGMPAAEVRSIFEKYRIAHGYIPANELTVGRHSSDPVDPAGNGRLVAVVRNVETIGLVKKNISIKVDLDMNNFVSRIRIEPEYIGP
ncbi:MAG TPA: hypothetical protein VFK88_09700 [Gallionella sp.]|nr:hypothetical protein [Gallionella sp.]